MVPTAVPFGKRDHRGSPGREHFGRSSAVPFGKRDHRGFPGREHFGRSVLGKPFRGPFWQKGPQGFSKPRAFWPECFGQALTRSLLAKGTTGGLPAESILAGVFWASPSAVPFGKRDHRGSAGREHFGRSVLVCPLPRSLLAKGATGGPPAESILAGVFWFVPFRGPFWQKGPQGVRRPRAFWPECFGLSPSAVPFGKRDHRGSAGREHFGKVFKKCFKFLNTLQQSVQTFV